MNETVEKLKKANDTLKATNQSFSPRDSALEKGLSEMEQYSRKNNVEIKGDKIECPVSDSDLEVVHSVPSKADTPHIIVRFCSRPDKAEFLSKVRKARLQTKDLGIHEVDPRPIYVNEHLTPEKKRLFAKALKLKKENEWMFLWTDDCLITARKHEGSKVLRIPDDADIGVFTN
ncbi:hypothetical protein HPB48_011596 [Haemaphysalis longicornis]|uniref:FP protein C-terminal domain-containing protein n=1 Tax=Haemaphysalis longicornis TaxID=44386 RepID=A0A9J6GSU5_HAELO|nr:hypothetical protein HPB48_011596 [Haemaphysalis longicornis]